MARIDTEDRILLLKLYYRNQESVAQTFRAYKSIKGIKDSGDPFTRVALMNIINRFDETGSIHDKQRPGRTSESQNSVPQVDSLMKENEGQISVRRSAAMLQIPKSTIALILHRHIKVRPYKFQILQQLNENQQEGRMTFAERFLDSCNIDPTFIDRVIFSDEANFYLNGVVSNSHFRIWSDSNPHAHIEKSLNAQKITVWFAFSKKFFISPFFTMVM